MSNKQPEPLVQLEELGREINNICNQLEHERDVRRRLERELQKAEGQLPGTILVAVINKLDALQCMIDAGTDPRDFLTTLIDDLTRLQASVGQRA